MKRTMFLCVLVTLLMGCSTGAIIMKPYDVLCSQVKETWAARPEKLSYPHVQAGNTSEVRIVPFKELTRKVPKDPAVYAKLNPGGGASTIREFGDQLGCTKV